MPGRKKLSIEIGPKVIRAAESTCKRKEIDVERVFEIRTPADCVRNGYILNPDRLGELLRMHLDAAGMNVKNAVFTINSDDILVGDAEISVGSRREKEDEVDEKACELFGLTPSAKDSGQDEETQENEEDSDGDADEEQKDNDEAAEKAAEDAASEDSEDSDLMSIDNYCISYKTVETSDDGSKIRVIIFAAPLALIDTYRITAERAGLVLESTDCTMNSVYQWMKKAFESESVMLVRLDSAECSAAIMTDDVLRGHYVLKTDGSEILSAINEYNNVAEFEGADDFNDSFSDEDNPVVRAAYPLTEELKRIISSFLEDNPSEYLDKIILAGYGEGMRVLAKQIQNQTGVTSMTFEDLPDGEYVKDTAPFGDLDPASFLAPVGALIDPLNFTSGSEGGRPGVRQELLMKIMVGVLAALIIVMAITGVRYLLLKSHNNELNTQLDKVKYIEDIYDQYKDAETKNSEVSAIDKSTQQKNELLSQLYSDLESKMPTDAKITSMNSSDDLVTFSISADSKETAAEMILQLRDFEYLSDISVSELTDTTDASGNESVEFTVSAVLSGDVSEDYSLSDGANDDGLSDSSSSGSSSSSSSDSSSSGSSSSSSGSSNSSSSNSSSSGSSSSNSSTSDSTSSGSSSTSNI